MTKPVEKHTIENGTRRWRDKFPRSMELPEPGRRTGKDGSLMEKDKRPENELFFDAVSPLATKRSRLLGRIIGPKEDIFKSYLEGGVDVIGVSTYPYDGRTLKQLKSSAKKLSRAVKNSPYAMLVKSPEDIDRAREEGKLGVFLHNQGASGYDEPLQRGGFPGSVIDRLQILPFVPSPKAGTPQDLSRLKEQGLMVTGIAYNKENRLGAGCMRSEEHGLTELGEDYIRAAKDCGMAVDLCHLNEHTALDAITFMAEELHMPPIISHVDSYSLRSSHRNATGTDDVLRAVGEAGGVVGVSALAYAISEPGGENSIARIIEHIEHFVNVAGEDSVGLGLDYWTGVAPYNYGWMQSIRDWWDGRTGLWNPGEREKEGGGIAPVASEEKSQEQAVNATAGEAEKPAMFHPGTDKMAPGIETPSGLHNLEKAIREHFSPENGYNADVADKILGGNMKRVYSKWWEQARLQRQEESSRGR